MWVSKKELDELITDKFEKFVRRERDLRKIEFDLLRADLTSKTTQLFVDLKKWQDSFKEQVNIEQKARYAMEEKLGNYMKDHRERDDGNVEAARAHSKILESYCKNFNRILEEKL